MGNKPKYKYFIYKAKKRLGSKLVRTEVTENKSIILVLREEIKKPVSEIYFENVFKWQITTYTTSGYKTKKFFVFNSDIDHKKFDDILNEIENDFDKF